jgi:hypothetical protein
VYKKITFTSLNGVDFYPPKPGTVALPEWYKNTEEYITGKKEVVNGETPATVKKCIPVFDMSTAGYIMYTQVDIQVTQVDGLPYYQWPSQEILGFHPVVQALNHPAKNNAPYPKWINQYGIKTPVGYSCLFLPPSHNPNAYFTCLPGLVDTDKYSAPVNFPFVLNDVNFEGIIPAGTPMIQVIPIKRDSWKMSFGNNEDIKEQYNITNKLKTMFFNSYKKQFWSRKEYR